jgi:F-type H+-transporting ATPase subunit delta
MATSVYAKNLAKALFEDALKQNELIGWLSQLRLISDVIKDTAVSSVLKNSSLSFTEKSKVLKERVGEINSKVLNIVGMLSDNGKLSEMDDISTEYQGLIDAYHGVEGAGVAEIITAVPIDEDEKLKMGKRITEMLGKPVTLKLSVNPELLGGVIIRVGDKLIDGSVSHRLQTISKELI